ncbi:MAG: hypothetical protein BGO98_28340 [Myxococcales bacterium 68-20]|nr:MAG: hypothetical protein BGO98_28340 [Myxococcales bacterium 68-20]
MAGERACWPTNRAIPGLLLRAQRPATLARRRMPAHARPRAARSAEPIERGPQRASALLREAAPA